MPTPLKASLFIADDQGKPHEHADWTAYSIDSDLMIPADAWSFSIGPVVGSLPAALTEGREVLVKMADRVVMTGRIDAITYDVDRNGRSVSINGRDRAGVLVDCAVRPFNKKQATLGEIVAAVVRPLGVTKVRIDANGTTIREKINVEPGEAAWDMLQHAAEANGLWPWFTPDGTLVVGRPDYTQPPVATLVMKTDGRENNLVSLSETRDISQRFSEVTVLGQSHGTATEDGAHRRVGGAKDTGVKWFRPAIISDHEADKQAVADARARKFIADARLRGYTLTATLNGHAVNPAAAKPLLWTPGQRVHLVSEPHGVDAVFFVMARRFTGGRNQPSRTMLTLKEDGVWQIDAHPHQRRHRRGKNSTPGKIVDLTASVTVTGSVL